jgi:D-alanyl-lipoteichoic acid acyltransferase DltB (MBOAT superfamily)
MGGNRVGYSKWMFNIFITFLISGLWHGANWTYIIWGALNGIYLILEATFIKWERKSVLNIFITFLLICFSWIFFRANNVDDAFHVIHSIFTNPGQLYIPSDADVVVPIFSTIAILILLISEIKKEFFLDSYSLSENKYSIVRWIFYSSIVFIILYIGVFNSSQFIYFQF